MYGGHTVIKAFNGEEKSIQKFDGLNNELYGAGWKSQFLSGMLMPIMTFVGNLAYVGVRYPRRLPGGPGHHQRRRYSGLHPVRAVIHPAHHAGRQHRQRFAVHRGGRRACFRIPGCRRRVADPVDAVKPEIVKGNVSFKNVSFGYTPERVIIHNFSAEIKPGQKIALVGPTGAGKTTIVKLLMRFYDINSGSISIDGVDIRKFKREDLRGMFGMVLQDTWLFNGTIRENIRYGDFNATDDMVVAAAKMANVDHFVRTLPHGYDLELNEESSNISQGQKQLLTIARAFLADPRY